VYDKKSKNEVEDKETETRAHANGERYQLRESSKRMITIIGRREVSTEKGLDGGYWRGPVWNCRNKIQLLLPLSTSQMTKILEQCLCICHFPTTSFVFLYPNQTTTINTKHIIQKFSFLRAIFCLYIQNNEYWFV